MRLRRPKLLPKTRWQKKQEAAAPSRYYGEGGTIHKSGYLDVEVHNGQVVAVWYRCQILPFRQERVEGDRAKEMREVYRRAAAPTLTGVEVLDDERTVGGYEDDGASPPV